MGNRVAGTVDSLVQVGDSVRFVLGFETLQGSGAFKFRGLVKGNEASGVFRGYLDGRELSAGGWSLTPTP